ncbi:cupin domain-containing protein [Pseudomonas aeruginosa]|uniref:cupin domain-containing protein n=1 Tax=Pseudomonas aeruginosa TaxID=287 RepID=UPI000B4D3075|nr:cupin domain-containing protein [Pseudomonas aeruginosa]ASD20393.1 cupin [Pseudomonas aeruginosa]MCG7079560.1 cupin domain-containing protein [Pseudomonas aeruginosa]MCG7087308.1 cupin domain-containing protein [Pseudomonas aeruginosa]MCG7092840.1 cupin domain-containing protein [Pseudomonas aeruginosa]MCG7098898.1 cupin domain-containing protein [Pseudomonas aeruginosa]
MNNKHVEDVVSFNRSDVEPVIDTVNHPNVLSGEYISKTWVYFSDESSGYCAGVWEAGSCREAFVSEHVEYCHVLEGIVRLTDSNGNSEDYFPKESFVIPAGFEGVWENIGTVRKYFVIS